MTKVLTLDDEREWTNLLHTTVWHNIFHLPAYHRVAQLNKEGEPILFVYQCSDYTIAIPLLLREVRDPCSVDIQPRSYTDATSVYGYPGPISSAVRVPGNVMRGFEDGLRQYLVDNRAVSAFSRLDPLASNGEFLGMFGKVVDTGTTVSIDLTLHEAVQRKQYRRCHLTDIRRLQDAGFTCSEDVAMKHYKEFQSLYLETMCRVNSEERLRFSGEYFDNLRSLLAHQRYLFVVQYRGCVTAAVLVLSHNRRTEMMLAATARDFLYVSPVKLAFDTVRQWATMRGDTVLHLGGGVGGANDSLLHFKTGFSNRKHKFPTWRAIVDPTMYRMLCDRALQGFEDNLDCAFFPAYRVSGV